MPRRFTGERSFDSECAVRSNHTIVLNALTTLRRCNCISLGVEPPRTLSLH